MDEWMGGWIDGCVRGWEWVDFWMNGWAGGWMDQRTDGWMDGWVGEWVGVWMDGWISGPLDLYRSYVPLISTCFYQLQLESFQTSESTTNKKNSYCRETARCTYMYKWK